MKLKRIIRKTIVDLVPKVNHLETERLINETAWIRKLQCNYFKIIKLLPQYPVKLYIEAVANQIKAITEIDDSIKNSIRNKWLLYFREQDDNVKAFMSHLFFYTNLLNDSVMQEIVHFLLITPNKSFRYWLTLDIDKMVFFLPDSLYANYYNDRRKLLESIASESMVVIPLTKKTSARTKKKYCIITYLLDSSISNSMQRVAMMMASGLKSDANEITVLCLDCFAKGAKDCHNYCSMMNYGTSTKKRKKISNLFSDDIIINYAK